MTQLVTFAKLKLIKMKILVNTLRWLVGLLFIFSGLIKVNDPSGLSYKMQEFFEVWGIHWMNPFSMALAIFMNICEVVAGVGLILGVSKKFFSGFLLLLIIFFTFLTSYVLFSGKITACGCLGDCIPLTPIQTFGKDVILSIMALIIYIKRDYIEPFAPKIATSLILGLSLIGSFLTQLYVLDKLPFLDCLPYKTGNNLLEQMKKPAAATDDEFAYVFEYKKEGKTIEYTDATLPENLDSTYVFVGRKEKLVKKGNGLKAKIVDFTLKTNSGNDTTQAILHSTGKYVFILMKEFPDHSHTLDKRLDEKILKQLEAKNIPVYVVTADAVNAPDFKQKNVMVLSCDATVIKTAARVNPTYFVMNGANILAKYSYSNANKIFNFLP